MYKILNSNKNKFIDRKLDRFNIILVKEFTNIDKENNPKSTPISK